MQATMVFGFTSKAVKGLKCCAVRVKEKDFF